MSHSSSFELCSSFAFSIWFVILSHSSTTRRASTSASTTLSLMALFSYKYSSSNLSTSAAISPLALWKSTLVSFSLCWISSNSCLSFSFRLCRARLLSATNCLFSANSFSLRVISASLLCNSPWFAVPIWATRLLILPLESLISLASSLISLLSCSCLLKFCCWSSKRAR